MGGRYRHLTGPAGVGLISGGKLWCKLPEKIQKGGQRGNEIKIDIGPLIDQQDLVWFITK
jgi:hypothetical protein